MSGYVTVQLAWITKMLDKNLVKKGLLLIFFTERMSALLGVSYI